MALKLHLENEELLSGHHNGPIKGATDIQNSKLDNLKLNQSKNRNVNQFQIGNSSGEDISDDEIPDNQELTDLAEEHQRGIEEIESETEYEEKIRQKIYESGSDFISLNKKKIKATE